MTTTTDVTGIWASYRSTRDIELREQLITMHLPLVRYLVSRMARTLHARLEYDDLVSYGTFGLIDAIERYDPEAGVKFSTFAAFRIQGAVNDGLRSQMWVPRTIHTRHKAALAATVDLEKTLGRLPSEEEVATHVGTSVEELRRTEHDVRSGTDLRSLNSTTRGGVDGDYAVELGETLIDNGPSDMGLQLEELQGNLSGAIATLPERERLVFEWYYVKGQTFKQIAERLGVHDSWVCHLHTRTMVSLQRLMAAQY